MSTSPVVHRARRFEELLSIPGGDGPYVFTRLFRESSWRERWLSRKTFRLLKRVDGEIRENVDEGEIVLRLSIAAGMSRWERWFAAWRRALVLTDQRLILIPLDSRKRPCPLTTQIDFGAIRSITTPGRRRLALGLSAGRPVVLRGLPEADRRFLVSYLREAAKVAPDGIGAPGVRYLCPECRRPALRRPWRCPHCLGAFRWPWLAAVVCR